MQARGSADSGEGSTGLSLKDFSAQLVLAQSQSSATRRVMAPSAPVLMPELWPEIALTTGIELLTSTSKPCILEVTGLQQLGMPSTVSVSFSSSRQSLL